MDQKYNNNNNNNNTLAHMVTITLQKGSEETATERIYNCLIKYAEG